MQRILLLIAVSLIIASWLAPNHYLPWLASHSDFLAFLSLIFAILAVLPSLKLIKFIKINLFFILIALIPIIQFAVGKIYFFGDAFLASIYIMSFFIAITLGNNITHYQIQNFKVYELLCGAVLFSGVVSVYIALEQWLLLSNGGIWMADLPPNARPFGNFAQPNTFATFLCMGLISSVYFYEKKYINNTSAILIDVVIIFGIALAQSRTTWIFVLAFLLFWYLKGRYLNMRLKSTNIYIFITIYVLFIATIPYIASSIGVTSVDNALTRASTGLKRIPMWHQMIVAIKNEPWVGYGWNQISIAQLNTTIEQPHDEWIEHSHNILLDLLIWNGLPIGLCIIGFSVLWFYILIKRCGNAESFIILAVALCIVTHSMFEYPLEYAFFLLPFGFLLGLAQAQDKILKAFYISKFYINLFVILSILMYIWVYREYRVIEKDFQLLRFELANIGTLHSNKPAPNIILLTQLREQIRFLRTQPRNGMSREELEWMRKIAYRYATQGAIFRYAQALALNDYPELAKKQLLIIEKLYNKKINPTSLYEVRQSLAFAWENNASKPQMEKRIVNE